MGRARKRGSKNPKALEGGQVGRAFHQDFVPRVNEYLGDEIEPLLGTVEDQDLLGSDPCSPRRVALGDHVPQRGETLRGGVLQRTASVIGQHLPGRFRQLLHGKKSRVGKSPGERDDLGIDGRLQDFPDEGAMDGRHPPGELHEEPSFIMPAY